MSKLLNRRSILINSLRRRLPILFLKDSRYGGGLVRCDNFVWSSLDITSTLAASSTDPLLLSSLDMISGQLRNRVR